jgi:hypothetical protein
VLYEKILDKPRADVILLIDDRVKEAEKPQK